MNIENILVVFLSIGLISALILLIFPKINYLVKAILISYLGGLWVFISTIFFAANFTHTIPEAAGFAGVLIFISAICGIGISIITGSLIMLFFLEKKKTGKLSK